VRAFVPLAALLLCACATAPPQPPAVPAAPVAAAAQPAATPTPIWKDQVFVVYKAALDAAAKDDPREVVRQFVAAFAHYDEDRAFALDLMAAAAADTLVHDDPKCRSGKLFNQELDPLWVAMDGHPRLPMSYFDDPANALAPDASAHVQLDESATSVTDTHATVAIKVAGGASRQVWLVKQATGWRISDLSGIT